MKLNFDERDKNMMNRNEMLNKLHENVCKVTFTKKNGENRVMNCTLQPKVLKETLGETYEDDAVSRDTADVITVMDTDKGAWRRFRVDSVSSFE
jgi:hypothetical protein